MKLKDEERGGGGAGRGLLSKNPLRFNFITFLCSLKHTPVMSPLLSTALAPLELSSENEKSTRKKKRGEEFRLCLNYFKFYPRLGWVKIKKRGERFSEIFQEQKVMRKSARKWNTASFLFFNFFFFFSPPPPFFFIISKKILRLQIEEKRGRVVHCCTAVSFCFAKVTK